MSRRPLAIVVAATLCFSLSSTLIASERRLQVFYSGNTNGNLKACG